MQYLIAVYSLLSKTNNKKSHFAVDYIIPIIIDCLISNNEIIDAHCLVDYVDRAQTTETCCHGPGTSTRYFVFSCIFVIWSYLCFRSTVYSIVPRLSWLAFSLLDFPSCLYPLCPPLCICEFPCLVSPPCVLFHVFLSPLCLCSPRFLAPPSVRVLPVLLW